MKRTNWLKENERDVLRTVGERIASRRNKKGLTQRRLADMVGTTQTSIRRMEKGQTNTSIIVLMRTFKVLGMDLVKHLEGVKPREILIEIAWVENEDYIEQTTSAMGLTKKNIQTKRTLMEMLDIWTE